MTVEPLELAPAAEPVGQSETTGRDHPDRARIVLATAVMLLWFVVGFAGPLLYPQSPTAIDIAPGRVPPFPPSAEHWFGTDQLGRDLLARVLHGVRVSLLVAVVVRSLVMAVGVLFGLATAFSPLVARAVLLRAVDIVLAFPPLLAAMALTAVLGPSLPTLVIVLIAIGWPEVARLSYGETLSIRSMEFVEASRALGATTPHLVRRHVMPALRGQLATAWSIGIPGAVMYEAGLSFFGFGVQPPDPSLGSLINEGRGWVALAPWYLVTPTLTLVALVVSFNLAGEALAGGPWRRGGA